MIALALESKPYVNETETGLMEGQVEDVIEGQLEMEDCDDGVN